jgi:MFS family permease
MVCMSSAYIGFAFSQTVFELFLFYAMVGMGLGIATPAKNVLFATHLDKDREATEWGITDAIEFVCMAIATLAGGLIANWLGFRTLFLLAAFINLVGTLPYLRFFPTGKNIELPFVRE